MQAVDLLEGGYKRYVAVAGRFLSEVAVSLLIATDIIEIVKVLLAYQAWEISI